MQRPAAFLQDIVATQTVVVADHSRVIFPFNNFFNYFKELNYVYQNR